MTNKKAVDHLDRYNLLRNKQYMFWSCRSTADILIVITWRISKSLDNEFIMRAIALDISRASNKVIATKPLQLCNPWKCSCNHCPSYEFLKIILNGQASKDYEINAGIPQSSLLSTTLF